MRPLAEQGRIREFMRALSGAAREPVRVYFTGGVSAVLMGWRDSTIAVDPAFVPEADDLLRALPAIKESLQINAEPARLRELFDQMADRLYRYPAVDPPALRRALEAAVLPQ